MKNTNANLVHREKTETTRVSACVSASLRAEHFVNAEERPSSSLALRGTSGERAGERGVVGKWKLFKASPLPDPLPIPSSWGEGTKVFHAIATGSRCSGRLVFAALLLAGLALAGGGCLSQSYPETEIHGYINGQPFAIRAPKDSNLNGFDATAGSNGAVHVHIDSLQCSLNPTNLAAAANGQAAIINAVSQALNQAVQTGGAMALKAAAAP